MLIYPALPNPPTDDTRFAVVMPPPPFAAICAVKPIVVLKRCAVLIYPALPNPPTDDTRFAVVMPPVAVLI